MKPLPFYIPKARKRYPFRAQPPRIGHYMEYPPGHTSRAYFPTRKVHKLLSSRENGVWVGQVNIRKNFEYRFVLHLLLWSSLRRLKQPLFHDPSAFCRVKCAQAGMERDRSGEVENTVPFDIRKFRKVKPEFLVEWNAPYVYSSWHEKGKTKSGVPWLASSVCMPFRPHSRSDA